MRDDQQADAVRVGRGQRAAETADGEIPAPVVVVKEMVRGIGPKHASCDDTGLLSVAIEWPRGKYKLRDIGFEFKVVVRHPGLRDLSRRAGAGSLEGRNSDFLFMWQEGGPAQQTTYRPAGRSTGGHPRQPARASDPHRGARGSGRLKPVPRGFIRPMRPGAG